MNNKMIAKLDEILAFKSKHGMPSAHIYELRQVFEADDSQQRIEELERRVAELEHDCSFLKGRAGKKDAPAVNYPMTPDSNCPHCGGDIWMANPTGQCSHIHYPEDVNKSLKGKPSLKPYFKHFGYCPCSVGAEDKACICSGGINDQPVTPSDPLKAEPLTIHDKGYADQRIDEIIQQAEPFPEDIGVVVKKQTLAADDMLLVSTVADMICVGEEREVDYDDLSEEIIKYVRSHSSDKVSIDRNVAEEYLECGKGAAEKLEDALRKALK